MYDLIVVGGGPAGLTATMYAIRKRINVLLVSRDLGGKTNYKFVNHRPINGMIKTVTIKRDAVGKLWICFSVAEEEDLEAHVNLKDDVDKGEFGAKI